MFPHLRHGLMKGSPEEFGIKSPELSSVQFTRCVSKKATLNVLYENLIYFFAVLKQENKAPPRKIHF